MLGIVVKVETTRFKRKGERLKNGGGGGGRNQTRKKVRWAKQTARYRRLGSNSTSAVLSVPLPRAYAVNAHSSRPH